MALLAIAALLAPGISEKANDPNAAILARCLDNPADASTAGQTSCEEQAASAYDRRMNTSYAALLKVLPQEAAHALRLSQRAWIAFRDADARANAALYATRKGTMYVSMQAASATRVVRDRALQLEADLRVMRIDD